MTTIRRLALISALLATSTLGSGQTRTSDLKSVRRSLETQLHLHGQSVPMMGLISGLARGFTSGGVRALQVVTYDNLAEATDRAQLTELVRAQLSDSWSLMVRQHSIADTAAKDDMVWLQPRGKRIRMLVFSLESRELDLVQMELTPDALAKWQHDHNR